MTAVDGYKPVGIVGYAYNNRYCFLYNFELVSDTKAIAGFSNMQASDITIAGFDIKVLYVRNI